MRVAVSMGAAGFIHVLFYSVPSIMAWNVRPMAVRFWALDIAVPVVFAVLAVVAYRRRVTHPLGQAGVAVGVLLVMQVLLGFLRTVWEGGLDSAGGYDIWYAFALMLFSSVPTIALFIIALAVSEIERLSIRPLLHAAASSRGSGS